MRTRGAIIVLLAVCCAVASPARAINIVPVFNAADNETPPFDLFNGNLQNLVEYAETYFQDIYEDAGYTLTINFWYDDLQDTYLGLFNPVTRVGNRLVEANIRIDTRVGNGGEYRDWFMDSTPASDGEFDMSKLLWNDASFAVRSTFSPSIDMPESFEVGYGGQVVGGSPATGKYDMLSVVLHEVGHALGINSGADHENADGDYDIDPDFLFGYSTAIDIDTNDDGADPGHVSTGSMMMCGACASSNYRRRPSHADFFAIATSAELTQIDVPRREFYGGGVFNVAANWSGNRTPDANDEAFVRDAGLVVMNASDSVGALTIAHSQLATGNHALNAGERLVVESFVSNVLGKVIVAAGGSVAADDVEIGENGEIDLIGSTLTVDDDLDLTERDLPGSNDGVLSGSGTANIGGTLRSRGTIKPDAGTLTVTAGGFDLDGTAGGFGDRYLDATTGSLVLNGPHLDTFKGELDVGFAQLATFNNTWTLGSGGEVAITDGGLINNAPWRNDGAVTINHTVPFGLVGVAGTGPMTVGPNGQITTDGVVDFLSPATIEGSLSVNSSAARFNGGGTFADSAQVSVAGSATLNLTQSQTYSIEAGAEFSGTGSLVNGALATLVAENGAVVATSVLNNGRFEISVARGLVQAGSFEQAATGTLEIEIAGHQPGASHDQLDVLGDVVLAGSLQLVLAGGFEPSPGDTFEIIAAGDVDGVFGNVLGTDLAGPSYFGVIYEATAVLVTVISGLAGDYNNNGHVDAADYSLWRNHLGQNVSLPNDSTPGVAPEDFKVWKANFGASLGAGAGASAPVPEPSFAILVLSLLTTCSCRRFIRGFGGCGKRRSQTYGSARSICRLRKNAGISRRRQVSAEDDRLF